MMWMIRLGVVVLALAASPAFAAKCYINEFTSLGFARNERAQVVNEPAIASQVTADFSGGAQQSSAFNPGTAIVRVWCDTQASVLFGTNPTAANTDMPIAAAAPEYFAVPVNQVFKLSVHANP